LNANDLGPDGRLYMSDNGAGPSFVFSDKYRNGRIFVLDPRTGASSVWFDRDTRGELDVAIALPRSRNLASMALCSITRAPNCSWPT
jgi:hypothetical protein